MSVRHGWRVLDGQPIIILTNTITALLEAGCLPNKKAHALAQLLTSVRIIAPSETQTEIDRLVPLLNTACAQSEAVTVSSGSIGTAASLIQTGLTSVMKRPVNPLQSFETPLAERTPTVFISYSHTDNDFTLRLIDDLQGGGHAVWIDKMNIKGGAEWVRSIADGISNSYAFVTILSPDANSSRWVQREYLYADNLGKPIFPVMARPSEVPFQMIDRQVLSLIDDYAMGLERLLTVLPSPRAITITQEMMQPAPVSPKIIPMPRPAPVAPSAPPLQAGSSMIPPPQPMPAPMLLPRQSGGMVRRLVGLVGVLLVGAIGISVILGGMNSSIPSASLTPGVRPTQTSDVTTGDAPVGDGVTGILLVVMIGAGAALAYFVWMMRRAAVVKGVMPEPTTVLGGVDRQPSRGGGVSTSTVPPASVFEEEDGRKKAEARNESGVDSGSAGAPVVDLDDVFIPPVMPMVDRRALELMYLNRVMAQRVDAMVDMEAPSADDYVRVMAMSGLSVNEADWAGVERQKPDKGGGAALAFRRAILMGDDHQDSMTAMWAAAGALMQFAAGDPSQPIPLVVDLSGWSGDMTLEAFIRHEMGELGDYLDGLLRDKRAALLFDGLYRLSVERLAEVEAFLKAQPDLITVVDMTQGV
jgi:hypothetical protein